MSKLVNLIVSPEEAASELLLLEVLKKQIDFDFDRFEISKKSVDARGKRVKINLQVKLYEKLEENEKLIQDFDFKNVSQSTEIHIIGAGPAGYFAAIECLLTGYKPIIWERGKEVKKRRRDLVEINRNHQVNEDSNYCFGEGGAGTYSDGKLYTRSNKRGDIRKVLELFVHFGASPDILIWTHPHIGTNKLPLIMENMRNQILSCGGEIHFESKLTDIQVVGNEIKSIIVDNQSINVKKLILATGHSARDIFTLLQQKNIAIESKPYALGVRIEHPQMLIDSLQYHCDVRSPFLPPASYNLVAQTRQKAVFSFCMCPGGIIAPCATANGEIVTNGWSPSKRNNPFANSGIVVPVDAGDFKEFSSLGALAGLEFQKNIEQLACQMAGGNQTAPAQRLTDFIKNKNSVHLPECSYTPGIQSHNLHTLFPKQIAEALKYGFLDFEKKMNGFLTDDAVLVAVESRTSSPVKIPRNPETFEHIQVKGLFPAAEGAGYAGGIMSAAIDGMNIVQAISVQEK